MAQMTTRMLREIFHNASATRLALHLDWARSTMALTPLPGRTPDVVFCARTAAVIRAEQARRAKLAAA